MARIASVESVLAKEDSRPLRSPPASQSPTHEFPPSTATATVSADVQKVHQTKNITSHIASVRNFAGSTLGTGASSRPAETTQTGGDEKTGS